MKQRRIARKKFGRGSKRINPAVKRELGAVATLLDRRWREQLKRHTIYTEAERLYKRCPFEFKGSRNNVPLKSIKGMGHFLIGKKAQEAGFSKTEMPHFVRIVNLLEQDIHYKTLWKEMDKIGKPVLNNILNKLRNMQGEFGPDALPYVEFSFYPHGTELYHIFKFGCHNAVELIDHIEAEIEVHLGI